MIQTQIEGKMKPSSNFQLLSKAPSSQVTKRINERSLGSEHKAEDIETSKCSKALIKTADDLTYLWQSRKSPSKLIVLLKEKAGSGVFIMLLRSFISLPLKKFPLLCVCLFRTNLASNSPSLHRVARKPPWYKKKKEL
jgi:hypothetical protein